MSDYPFTSIAAASNFFENISVDLYPLLGTIFDHLTLAVGDQLIRQGDIGEHLYVVVKGELKVVDETYGTTGKILEYKKQGDGVGEISLFTGERRTASVYATTEAELLSLSRKKLEEITLSAPHIAKLINDTIRGRIHRSRLNHILRITDIFKSLDEDILQDLQAKLELITVVGGETVMHANEAGDALYIVLGGRLRVTMPSRDSLRPYFIDVHRGQTVGEIGLITGARRTATVVALRDSLLARLPKSHFSQLLHKYPEAILSRFAGPIIERLQSQLPTRARAEKTVQTIAVIPTDRTIPLAEFTTKLATALSKLGRTAHLNSHRCDEILGEKLSHFAEDDPRNSRFVFWLNEQEVEHQYVIYEADFDLTAWTMRCIRQADMVLFIAHANKIPPISAIEQMLSDQLEERPITKCFALLQDRTDSLPTDTKQWLQQRQARDFYHVRLNNDSDINRLGRLLTGQGIGLVLGGGGARALSQIGVIRGLLERNIPIDAIAGVSAGSIIAGLWAMYLDTSEVQERAKKAIKRVDYTFPIHALTSGHNWTEAMSELYGNIKIEDLWTTFFCVSTNITQAELLIHKTDSLMHAVRASTAIPGLLPPVFQNGHVLIDGGILNNLPTDIMKNRPDINYVIAVDVGGKKEEKVTTPFGYSMSGWKALWQRINPWGQPPDTPTISDIILRAITIPNVQSAFSSREMTDMYLTPPVEGYGLLDYSKIDDLVEVGYRYVQEKAINWPVMGTHSAVS
ncbi:MAG: cyclic nucleotide-binding domain-containing protein [Anaerolineae bacterium]|nr:cyclic nucleotide-binding domain-containing protein [Anaerolineae bacterium]